MIVNRTLHNNYKYLTTPIYSQATLGDMDS